MNYLKIRKSKYSVLYPNCKRSKNNILIPQQLAIRFRFSKGTCYTQKLNSEIGVISIKHFLVPQDYHIHIYCDRPVLLFKFRIARKMFRDKIRLHKDSICYFVYYPQKAPIPLSVHEDTSLIFFECLPDFLHELVNYIPQVSTYLTSLKEKSQEAKISPPFTTNQEMRVLLEDILNLDLKDEYSFRLRILSFFNLFLSNVLVGFQELSIKNKEETSDQEKVMEIKQYILQHLNLDLSLESVSKLFYISKSSLSLKFEKYISCSLAEFVYLERMKLAKSLLIETSQSNDAIAYEIGYESGESFSKAFKKMAKESPGKYRKRKKSKD